MLEFAMKFKKAFANLLLRDSSLQNEMVKFSGNLANTEWNQVASFLPFLKTFYDVTLKLLGSHYVTCNAHVMRYLALAL